jgi:hypothetical protein
MQALAKILEGTADAAALEEFSRGFRVWLASATAGRRDAQGKLNRARPLSLERCLGLPATPERARRELRDHYLREAAKLLPVATNKQSSRAAALLAEVRLFEARRWVCWRGKTTPPIEASDMNRFLFEAMRHAGGTLPKSKRQYVNILNS